MQKNALILLVVFTFVINGCALILQTGRRSDVERIEVLEDELQELKAAKKLLASQLSSEIEDKQVRLRLAEKGLVITFVAEVLFDSGKTKLKKDSLPILSKVVRVLNENVPNNDIGVEGHTDNEPIKHSRWKSNWELSSQRALSVLYFLEKKGVDSVRLLASGYGEYKPIASNNNVGGRQLNRRVEIVILPKTVKNVESQSSQATEEEELK